MGWYGSGALKEALKPAPCGCDLIRRAITREKDARARTTFLALGARAQEEWQCPRRPGAERAPPPDGALPEKCHRALEQVALVTGVEGFATCPVAGLSDPAVRATMRARRWFRRGQLDLVVADPSAALVAAIDAVEDGVAAREAHDADAQLEKMERARAEQEAKSKRGRP